MNKTELIETIAKDTGLTKKDAEAAVNSFIKNVTATLKKKDRKVALMGFGTFETVKRKARDGVNPATGEKIKIAAKTVPHFKPGKLLKDAVAKK